jgi:ethanolamine permease
MEHEAGTGGVEYEKVGAEYFAQRTLRKYAGVFSLWALGVGAVISGH